MRLPCGAFGAAEVGRLPARFHAEPLATLGGGVEIDLATLEQEGEIIQDGTSGNGL